MPPPLNSGGGCRQRPFTLRLWAKSGLGHKFAYDVGYYLIALVMRSIFCGMTILRAWPLFQFL